MLQPLVRLDQPLTGVRNCPFCGVANPTFIPLWTNGAPTLRADGGEKFLWSAQACTTCGHVVTVRAAPRSSNPPVGDVLEIYPSPKLAHGDIPDVARQFLQQAFDTKHAPDAAGVMAGAAVDAMLKAHGYKEGSLYNRIDAALNDGLLTKGMADWAHSVRLGSNRPRHADEDRPHLTPEEALQSIEFAEALGNFLFVLTAQIERGLAAAGSAE